MSLAADDKSKMDEDMTEDLTPALLAAQMYVISRQYLSAGLGDQSLARFKTELVTRREPNLLVSDLIAIIELIFDGAPDHEYGIRKWIVWRSQMTKEVLNDSAAFGDLLERRPDFARDMVTKYAARNYLWCPNCNYYVDLESCDCGWSGMCGRGICAQGNANAELHKLSCAFCSTKGHLQRERPSADDDDY